MLKGVDSRDLFYKRAKEIREECGEKNPIDLAEDLGIYIYQRDDFKKLLGMYALVLDRRCIFVKRDLDEYTKNLVVAHEIGHDQFHRDLARENGLRSFILFNMRDRAEYEANVFASHLLISDREIVEMIEEGFDLVQMSQKMGVDINLCLIKVNELIRMGYDFNPQSKPDASFMRRL